MRAILLLTRMVQDVQSVFQSVVLHVFHLVYIISTQTAKHYTIIITVVAVGNSYTFAKKCYNLT